MIKNVVLYRNRIDKRLKEAATYSLTVICAPMGYGKTTGVKTFLEGFRGRVHWLTIKQKNHSPQALWRLMIEGMKNQDQTVADHLGRFDFPVNQLQRTYVFRVIEKHAARNPCVFVFDNYHYVQSESFQAFLEMLVRCRMENVSLILISRNAVKLPVDEFEVKGYCKRIEPDFWLMTKEEMKKLFPLYHLFPTAPMIDEVFAATKGWMIATCLMLQYYKRYGRFEFGYDLERMMQDTIGKDLSEDELGILLKLSVFDTFTLGQAASVLGREVNGDQICKICEGCGLIVYDHDYNEYYFQQNFRAYLKREFNRKLGSRDKRALYLRAGEFLLEQGDRWKGLALLLKTDAYQRMIEVLDQSNITEWRGTNQDLVVSLFSAMPDALKFEFPKVYLKYIGFYLTHIELEGGARMLDDFNLHIKAEDHASSDEWNWIQGQIEMAKGFIAFNDLAEMNHHHQKAAACFQQTAWPACVEGSATYGSIHLLHVYHKRIGELLATASFIKDTYGQQEVDSDGCEVGIVNQVMAEYFLETGQYTKGCIQGRKALMKARKINQNDLAVCAYFAVIRSEIACGKTEAAWDSLLEMKHERDQMEAPNLAEAYDLAIGYLSYIIQDEKGFSERMKHHDLAASDFINGGMGIDAIVSGQFLLMTKAYLQVEVLVEDLIRRFAQFDNIMGFIHAYLLDAIAKYHLYGLDGAIEPLENALRFTREDGIVLPFCEYAWDLNGLLDAYQSLKPKDAFVKRLIKEKDAYIDHLKKINARFGHNIVLTPKEKDVMRLLLEGKSNREIATELFVAEITVKKHVSAIYKKLEVRGRTSAVKRCMEMNLL